MEDTTRPSRGDLVQAGWRILMALGLIIFIVDTEMATTIILIGIITAIPLKAVEFDTTIFRDFWGTKTPQSNSFDEERRDALAHLRSRYARGDLTEEEFEQKLERLLETETIEQIEKEFESDKE